MSEPLYIWDPASSIPTLIGSLLSLFATSLVILLWIFAGGKKRRDFRYALILNLAVAEFLNSLNNSISGVAAVIRRKRQSPDLACEINGWAGQFSVQAVDFTILAITLVTLLTIQLRSFVIYASTTTKALICLSIWIVPLCTSVIAWTKGYYGPVSGNWCWIEDQYTRQRYILNHGWRFAIILISICTYVYVFAYMSRRMRPQGTTTITSSIPDDLDYAKIEDRPRDHAVLAGCGSTPRLSLDGLANSRQKAASDNSSEESDSRKASITARSKSTPNSSDDVTLRSHSNSPPNPQPTVPSTRPDPQQTQHHRAASSFSFARKKHMDASALDPPSKAAPVVEIHVLVDLDLKRGGPPAATAPSHPAPPPTPSALSPFPFRRPVGPHNTSSHSKTKLDRDIWRMLLLNMYPVTYLILWIPGIANRIAEAMGHSVRALVILQSSTQFIGLANAAVYLYKEHRRDVREWWRGVRGRREGRRNAEMGVQMGEAGGSGKL
ncbi:hypothetical protein E8E13_003084 [Curvularia kusanoi]|uniref:Glucose receptor Git3-like N-terminal domain-containing protein n=1 Tax=Curvularia kusanoi TaxID=90978 RepID=A0A9P4TEL0_CURKU|nr:hypothetical protein E8E13_003084 [Curvularia kusanoi]